MYMGRTINSPHSIDVWTLLTKKIYSTQSYEVLDFDQRPIEWQDLPAQYGNFPFFVDPDATDMQDREGASATSTTELAEVLANDPNISVLPEPDNHDSTTDIRVPQTSSTAPASIEKAITDSPLPTIFSTAPMST